MRNIEFFFVASDFLICNILLNDTYVIQKPIRSIKSVKDLIEQLYEDLKNGVYSLSS